MKTFIKILFLLIVLTAIGAVIAWNVFHDDIHEWTRLRLESELSARTGHPVSIGRIHFTPFQTLTLDKISVFGSHDNNRTLFDANSLSITPDLLSSLKQRRLTALVELEGLHAGETLITTTLKIFGKKAPEYTDLLDPTLIDTITILDGLAGVGGTSLRNIYGTVHLEKYRVNDLMVGFNFNGKDYLAKVINNGGQPASYGIRLRSDEISLNTDITLDKKKLVFRELNGMIHTFFLEMNGEILAPFSREPSYTINGTIRTELSSLKLLPGPAGELAGSCAATGMISSRIFLKGNSTRFMDLEASVTVSGENLTLPPVTLRDISARITLKEGRMNAPLITGTVYDGTLSADVKMDLNEEDHPFILDLSLNNVAFGDLMRDINGNPGNAKGVLNSNLTLQGYAGDQDSWTGEGQATISYADLGPMPIIAPLLGDIYAAAREIAPGLDDVNITLAYADLEIHGRKIWSENITFMGDDISVLGEGYVDFDGDLDMEFENQLLDPSEDHSNDWRVRLRNAIVNFGRSLGKARLTGTIKKPVWGM